MITKLALNNSNVKVLAVFTILCLGACGGGIASGSATGTTPTGTTPTGPVPTGSTPIGNPPNLTPPLIDSPSALESRSSGVAPLSVFFDATATTSALTTTPFHKLQYTWNFGDTTGTLVSGTGGTFGWNTGASSGVAASCTSTSDTPGCRNYATGGIAGHVYEGSGPFTPSVSIFDGKNTVTLILPTINVTSPDAAFATNTICVAANAPPVAGVGNCPTGAHVMQQSDFYTAMITAISTNGCGTGVICKRILFNKGDSFTQSTAYNLYTNGPGLIGSYGTGANPVITSTMNDGQINIGKLQYPTTNSCTSRTSCFGGPLSDWRIMDLTFVGPSTSVGAINNSSSAVNILGQFDLLTFLRLNISAERSGIGNSDEGLELANLTGWCCNTIWTGITIQDVNIHDPQVGIDGNSATDPYGIYLAGDQVLFIGNHIDLNGGPTGTASHLTRFTYLGQAAITNNTLAHPGPTESNIKLMAPGFPAAWGGQGDSNTSTFCPNGAGCPTVDIAGLGTGYTRWVEISDNQFISGYNNYMVAAAPQNQNSDERIRDVVIERNHFVSSGFNTVSVALYLDGFDFTVRNNTFDLAKSNAPANAIAFIAEDGGTISVAPDDLMAYNNSYYTDYAIPGNNINFLQVNTANTTVYVENNLVYAPLSTNGQTSFIYGTPKAGSVVANNSTTVQMKTQSPSYSVMPPVNPSDFKPTTGSYAIGAGAIVPVWTDFFGLPRSAPYDMGAVNH